MDETMLCDKCGQPVDEGNDAAMLDCTLGSFMAIVAQPRHLLPVPGCEGSPSRAQYLEGQPRDNRPGAVYAPEDEARVREAWKIMQAKGT